MWRSLGGVLVVLIASCVDDDGYRVRVDFDPDELSDMVTAVDLLLVPGECPTSPEAIAAGPTATPAAAVTLRRADPDRGLGDVAPGRYALYAIGRTDSCDAVAAGCRAFTLEAGGSGILEVPAEAAAGPGCAAGCRMGSCLPPDAGVVSDGGTPPDGTRPDATIGPRPECDVPFVVLEETDDFVSDARVAKSPTGWIVGWRDSDNVLQSISFSEAFDQTGRTQVAPGSALPWNLIGEAWAYQGGGPAVALHQGGIWTEVELDTTVGTRFVSVDGNAADGFRAVWEETTPMMTMSVIKTSLVPASGSVPAPQTLITEGAQFIRPGSVAVGDDGFAVAWRRAPDFSESAELHQFDASGNPIAAPIRLTEDVDPGSQVHLVWAGDRYAAGWGEAFTVKVAFIPPGSTAVPVATPAADPPTGNNTRGLGISWSSRGVDVAWTQNMPRATFFARIRSDGTVALGARMLPPSDPGATGTNVTFGGVASSESETVVAVTETGSGGVSRLVLHRISELIRQAAGRALLPWVT